MHGEPQRVQGRSARHRLLAVLGAASAGVVLAASCRAVRLAADDGDADRPQAQAVVVNVTPANVATAKAKSTANPKAKATPTTARPTTTAPPAPPTTVADRKLFILTDSVIVGASFAIPDALPGWQVVIDGKPSRQADAGVAALRARRAELGSVLLVQLGNNYMGDEVAFAAALDELYTIVGPDRWLILVHVYPIQANRAEVNAAMDALAAAHPNVRVADWPAVQDANPGSTYGDQLHLNMQGAQLMAGFVRDVVGEVAGRAPPR